MTSAGADFPVQSLWRGAGLTLAAYFFITVNDLLVKILVDQVPTGQILFFRSLVGYGCLLVLARFATRRSRLRPERIGRVALCAFLVVPVLYMFPFSLNYLPLTSALIVTFSSPILVVLLAPFVTGERPGKRRVVAVVVGFAGTVLVVDPQMGGWDPAYLLPIACAFVLAARDLVTRQIALQENPITISLAAFAIIVVTAPVTIFIGPAWVWLDFAQIAMLVAAGACLAFGQTTAILAFRYASTPVVSTLKFSAIVWSTLFSFLLFRIVPGPLEIVGAGLVAISSIAIVIIRDQRMSAAQTPILARKAPDRLDRQMR